MPSPFAFYDIAKQYPLRRFTVLGTRHPVPLSYHGPSRLFLSWTTFGFFSFAPVFSTPTLKLPSVRVSESWSPPLRLVGVFLSKVVNCGTTWSSDTIRLPPVLPVSVSLPLFVPSYDNVSTRSRGTSTPLPCARRAAVRHLRGNLHPWLPVVIYYSQFWLLIFLD